MTMNLSTRAGRRRQGLRALALAGLVLPLAACDLDEILTVDDPDVVTPAILEDSSAIPLRIAGTAADFQAAFSGFSLTGGIVPYGALFSDEFYNPDTFDTRRDIDLRAVNPASNTQTLTPYTYLHRARIQARGAAALVDKFEDTAGNATYAYAKNIEGFSEVLLGESFCSGVPFSEEAAGGALEFGQPLTTKQIFERARGTFDAALASAPAGDMRNLAAVGRGRALLALGDLAGAAAAVAAVPTSFAFYVEHSANSTSQENPVWALQNNRRLSVANNEGTGGNTIDFRNGDPRIPFVRSGLGFDNLTPLDVQLLYTDRDSDIPLASGVEARLIQAEAALNKGASDAYLAILNDLRANADHPVLGNIPAMAALTDPGTPAGRVDQFFEERARWLYLTGHRLGDMRRLIQHYGRTEDGVFPTGGYHKNSLEYGNQTSIPVPDEEKNNPNFTGCLTATGF